MVNLSFGLKKLQMKLKNKTAYYKHSFGDMNDVTCY